MARTCLRHRGTTDQAPSRTRNRPRWQNLEFFSQNPDKADALVSEPLGTRLFKARLALIAELDQQLAEANRETEPVGGYVGLRGELADFLHGQVGYEHRQLGGPPVAEVGGEIRCT